MSRSSKIWYRQTPRKKMNWETNTPRCRIYLVRYSEGCTRDIQTEWALHCSYPFCWNFGDFDFRVKARNAFLTRGFLPSDAAKIVQAERNIKFIWIFLRRSLSSSCGARLKYNLILNYQLRILNYFYPCEFIALHSLLQALEKSMQTLKRDIRFSGTKVNCGFSCQNNGRTGTALTSLHPTCRFMIYSLTSLLSVSASIISVTRKKWDLRYEWWFSFR